MESIRWLVDLARRAGIQRIVLNGSFVTDIIEPNDVDCVLLVRDSDEGEHAAEGELSNGLPFLDISLVGPVDFEDFVGNLFAVDRTGDAKGMIEVMP